MNYLIILSALMKFQFIKKANIGDTKDEYLSFRTKGNIHHFLNWAPVYQKGKCWRYNILEKYAPLFAVQYSGVNAMFRC